MPGGDEGPTTEENNEKVEPSSPSTPSGGGGGRMLSRSKPGVDKPIKPPRRGGGDGSGGDGTAPNQNAIAFMQKRNSSGLSRLKRSARSAGDAG